MHGADRQPADQRLQEARKGAAAETHKLNVEFDAVRAMLAAGTSTQPGPQLSQAKAGERATRWLQDALAETEDCRSRATSPTTEKALEAHEESLAHLKSEAVERPATRD